MPFVNTSVACVLSINDFLGFVLARAHTHTFDPFHGVSDENGNDISYARTRCDLPNATAKNERKKKQKNRSEKWKWKEVVMRRTREAFEKPHRRHRFLRCG